MTVAPVIFLSKPLLDNLNKLSDVIHSPSLSVKPSVCLLAVATKTELCDLRFRSLCGLYTLENPIASQDFLFSNLLRRREKCEDVEMVDHHTPTDQPDAGELGRTANDINEVIALLVLKKADLMGDTARNVVNRIELFVSVA